MSSKQMFYFAQADVQFNTLRSVGPGDSDVNTQSGRDTTVRVRTHTPAPVKGGTSIQVTLEATIEEGRKDYTRLNEKRVVTIQLPPGSRFNSFGTGFLDARYEEVFRGKIHHWINLTDRPNISGTVLDSCEIKIDGKGDDDRGNAALRAQLMVPVVVDIEEEQPSVPGKTNGGTTLLEPKIYGFGLPASAKSAHLLKQKARGRGWYMYSVR